MARFCAPDAVAVNGAAGVAYVADSVGQTIRKVTPAGLVTTFAGTALASGFTDGLGSAARFNLPGSIAVDNGGTIYVADTTNFTIRKITSAGVVTTFAGLASASGSADGVGSAARFNLPAGIAVGSSGTVYVADTNNHTIRKITPAGAVSMLAGTPGASGGFDGAGPNARFNLPHGIAVDSTETVYVADTNNHTIRKITTAGVVSTLAGISGFAGNVDGGHFTARLSSPRGVSIDGAGNVYVADTGNSTIRVVAPDGTVSYQSGRRRGRRDRQRNRWNRHQCSFQSTSRHRH